MRRRYRAIHIERHHRHYVIDVPSIIGVRRNVYKAIIHLALAKHAAVPTVPQARQRKELGDIGKLSLDDGQDSIMVDSTAPLSPIGPRKRAAPSPSDPSNKLRSPDRGRGAPRLGAVGDTSLQSNPTRAKSWRKQPDPDFARNIPLDGENPGLVLQPETRPITQDQLLAEIKGIYAGLVMVEAKCVDVDNKQAEDAQEAEPGKQPGKQPKLNNEQWQALIALHRTLLHEHHDFFLASQHPSASPALRRLASKYAMPARMWRHGIHSFLELLRHRLPDSLEHMLSFIYLAYSMMALLFETVPTFEDTWIECLGDLGRYRMAIEDDDIRDREVWTGVARFCCVQPFLSARESILTLFDPILCGTEPVYHRSLPVDTAFIKAHGILFTGVSLDRFNDVIDRFLSLLV
ncbi:MAG: hypothetical protein M1840_001793 [Geoglossum simile]|nr:MAG: hypothetical protein M1840_001793 [Geoglossum simile]